MKILIEYPDHFVEVEGTTDQVEGRLVMAFPEQALEVEPGNLEHLINAVEASGTHIVHSGELALLTGQFKPDVQKTEDPDVFHQLSNHHSFTKYLEAAKFIAQRPLKMSPQDAIYEADDLIDAALMAYGLALTEENRQALQGLAELGKAEEKEAPELKEVKPWNAVATDVAEAVQRAVDQGEYEPIKLNGKHVMGALIARDREFGGHWILKPNVGGVSTAAGVSQERAPAAQREACFWQAARLMGIHTELPRADVLMIDQKQYCAVEFLGGWKNLETLKTEDPNHLQRILELYRDMGMLHKWAILDFILGNVDRHSNNMMVKHDNIKLIDHGSTFAGRGFDPGHDKKSFIPFYLRYAVPVGFSKLSMVEKLLKMPQISLEADRILRVWLAAIDKNVIGALLMEYGINPGPTVSRMESLQKVDLGLGRYVCLAWLSI